MQDRNRRTIASNSCLIGWRWHSKTGRSPQESPSALSEAIRSNATATTIEQFIQIVDSYIRWYNRSAANKLLDEAAAANTTRSYTCALRYWAGWYATRRSS